MRSVQGIPPHVDHQSPGCSLALTVGVCGKWGVLAVALQSDTELKVMRCRSGGASGVSQATQKQNTRQASTNVAMAKHFAENVHCLAQFAHKDLSSFRPAVRSSRCVRGARVTSSSFRAAAILASSQSVSLSFHLSHPLTSVIHSWFLSFKASASSFFLRPRRCMAHRSTFSYVSCESSTTAILPPSTASTCFPPTPSSSCRRPQQRRQDAQS